MVLETARFTQSLPVRGDFRRVLDDSAYQAIPDDWLVALTDVVESRQAIAAGRYKDVNMAGVAMISAVLNALDSRDIPFIFGGDGAAVVCAPAERERVARTLGQTVTWVRQEFGLTLRAAIVPVSVLREQGFDVFVQASRVSEAITNYAFRGGGLSQAEVLMKRGEFAVPPAPDGDWPDLNGLSCRWSPIKSEGQNIVSIIIEAAPGREDMFDGKANRLLELAGLGARRQGEPLRQAKLDYTFPPPGLGIEARAMRGGQPLVLRKAKLYLHALFAWVLLTFNLSAGAFDPRHYKEFTALNTDYRKFQDGLRVTVSLGPAELATLEQFLEKERGDKNLRYGLCVQDSAILTCYVPSVMADTHFHFLDGAGGGYAQAAENMRS